MPIPSVDAISSRPWFFESVERFSTKFRTPFTYTQGLKAPPIPPFRSRAQLSCQLDQGSQYSPVEPFHPLWWCRYRRRSNRRSQRMQKQQGASVMSLSVTNVWVTSTRTFGSLIRSRSCRVSTVYTVCLRLARRGPQCLGTGCCSPLKRWISQILSFLYWRCLGYWSGLCAYWPLPSCWE